LPLARAVPRLGGGLDPGAALAGVQPGRLRDLLRRRAHGPARGARPRDRGERAPGAAARPAGPARAAPPIPARPASPVGRRRRMTQAGQRRVPVPDGLDGERLDSALARMFGLSRARAAELIGDGAVLVNGHPAAKSDRVPAGEWLDVTLPQPAAAPPPAVPVPGLAVVYEDADIVVVDKPAGVAAHPTPGWTGPTVLQGLAAAGHTIATSGAAERQGIVHRL